MAYADYYLCDNCGGKCFYDANLNWEFSTTKEPIEKESDECIHGFALWERCLECEVVERQKVQDSKEATITRLQEAMQEAADMIRRCDYTPARSVLIEALKETE